MAESKRLSKHLSYPTGRQGDVRVEHRYVARGLYTPKGASGMIIGTFPSILVREAFDRVRSTDIDFFYGSIDNNFWKDLGLIYNRPLSFTRSEEAVKQRMELMADLKLALSDAVFACYTTGSAMDTALQNVELNKYIISTLDASPGIKTLYFTSSSGKINAESLTLRLLKEEGRSNQMKVVQKSGPRIRTFYYKDNKDRLRLMTTYTLISPSPLAEKMAGITPDQRRAQYQKLLPRLGN